MLARKRNSESLVLFRNLRVKFFKHVQVGEICFGLVEVVSVGASPSKRFAGGAFDASGVDSAFFQDIFVLGSKIFTHNGDHADLGEVAGREGKVSSRPTQDALHAA